MDAFDYVILAAFLGGLAAMLAFSRLARAVVVHALMHPFRTTYLDAEGNDVTEAVRRAPEELARREPGK